MPRHRQTSSQLLYAALRGQVKALKKDEGGLAALLARQERATWRTQAYRSQECECEEYLVTKAFHVDANSFNSNLWNVLQSSVIGAYTVFCCSKQADGHLLDFA